MIISISNLKKYCLTALLFFSPLVCFAQIFQTNTFYVSDLEINTSIPLFGCVLDFNGDGTDEWIWTDYTVMDIYQKYEQPFTFLPFNFHKRLAVFPSIGITDQPFVACKLPPVTPIDTRERVLYLSGSQIRILLYVDDPALNFKDRYKILMKELPSPVENPVFVGLDRYAQNYSKLNNLILVHQEGKQSKLSLYEFNTTDLHSGGINMTDEFMLPSTPKQVFLGHINQDIHGDLVFEMEDHWLIWMGTHAGYAPADPHLVHKIPFPESSIETTQVLFQAMPGYPLILGIQNSDTILVALSGEDEPDWQRPPVFVTTPGSSRPMRVFLCEFKNRNVTEFPIILLGDMPLYEVYALFPQTISTPTFMQSLTVDEALQGPNDQYFYWEHPIDAGDFNGDGITDLFISLFRIKIRSGNLITAHLLGAVLGQPAVGIAQQEWVLQN